MGGEKPQMGGFEATAAVRGMGKEKGGHPPIIPPTGHAMKGGPERCLEAGMDSYVAKPIHPHELQGVIACHIQERSEPAPAQHVPTFGPVFDKMAMLAHCDGDSDLLAEMLGLFLDSSPAMLAEIR